MTGPAGTPAGTPAGRPAGTAAGTAAGTVAGTAAGTPAGTPAGPSAGTPRAPASTARAVPPKSPAEPSATEPADAGADAASTPSEQAADRRPRRRPGLPTGRWAWLAAAVAVVAVVLAVGALALLRPSSDQEVRESALLAARTYTQSLVTYDARTLEEDIARVRRASTDEFAAQYEETINGLRETIVGEQRVSTGTIVGAGIEDLDDTTATVLVAVDQQLSGSTGEPRVEANRLRVVLERGDGRWLIKSVTRL